MTINNSKLTTVRRLRDTKPEDIAGLATVSKYNTKYIVNCY